MDLLADLYFGRFMIQKKKKKKKKSPISSIQTDGKAWTWEAQDDTEAADRDGLQRVEALGC